ncbi:hypothetical protein KIH39_09980 [Telmatocola sphagniphila]|uniref:carbonic anhydrase n=1 Tax=Telmatocola sphagniphila TaxID=1123043 RepID=A0A8E6B989_9BACT|nr:carbonic anhydrase [Telmatocola sphagniphila]QVL34212.1 hypothetical protein KIH39_09980 [Telmatocola sphagniphila]
MLFAKMRNLVWMLLGGLLTLACVGIVLGLVRPPRKRIRSAKPDSSESALLALVNGNRRFVECNRSLSTDTSLDAENRHELMAGQHPYVAILTCADSRVCPEFIFDSRPGGIFEVRNAGNLVDEDVLASFEYAVEHLHVPLIVILAHKGCGAIDAVLEAEGKPLPHHLKALQEHTRGLAQEILQAHDDHSESEREYLCRENALQQARILIRESLVIQEAMERGRLQVICGIYDMSEGSVQFFESDSLAVKNP